MKDYSRWISWIGLPAIEGADPRLGRAGCCFRIAGIIRQQMGLPWPEDRMEQWYEHAWRGHWRHLRKEWDKWTEPNGPLPGSISLIDRGERNGSFGIGTIVTSELLLTTRPAAGVIAVPRVVWASWDFRGVLEAAW